MGIDPKSTEYKALQKWMTDSDAKSVGLAVYAVGKLGGDPVAMVELARNSPDQFADILAKVNEASQLENSYQQLDDLLATDPNYAPLVQRAAQADAQFAPSGSESAAAPGGGSASPLGAGQSGSVPGRAPQARTQAPAQSVANTRISRVRALEQDVMRLTQQATAASQLRTPGADAVRANIKGGLDAATSALTQFMNTGITKKDIEVGNKKYLVAIDNASGSELWRANLGDNKGSLTKAINKKTGMSQFVDEFIIRENPDEWAPIPTGFKLRFNGETQELEVATGEAGLSTGATTSAQKSLSELVRIGRQLKALTTKLDKNPGLIESATGVAGKIGAFVDELVAQVDEEAFDPDRADVRNAMRILVESSIKLFSSDNRFSNLDREFITRIFPGDRLIESGPSAMRKLKAINAVILLRTQQLSSELGQPPPDLGVTTEDLKSLTLEELITEDDYLRLMKDFRLGPFADGVQADGG
jgi:hypothetical protein